jgi:hypothetical protein
MNFFKQIRVFQSLVPALNKESYDAIQANRCTEDQAKKAELNKTLAEKVSTLIFQSNFFSIMDNVFLLCRFGHVLNPSEQENMFQDISRSWALMDYAYRNRYDQRRSGWLGTLNFVGLQFHKKAQAPALALEEQEEEIQHRTMQIYL